MSDHPISPTTQARPKGGFLQGLAAPAAPTLLDWGRCAQRKPLQKAALWASLGSWGNGVIRHGYTILSFASWQVRVPAFSGKDAGDSKKTQQLSAVSAFPHGAA